MRRRLRGKGPAARVHIGLADGDAATPVSESQNADLQPDPVEETLQPVADGEQQTDSVPVEPVEETLGDQAETPLVGGQRLTSSLLKQVMAQAIRGEDVEKVTFSMLMQKLADLLGVDAEELQGCKDRIRGFVDKVVRKEVSRQILDKVTQQSKHKKQKVEPEAKAIGSAQVLMAYLLTWSCPKQPSEERKSPEDFTRENLRDILLNSFIASQSEVADSRQAAIVLMAIFEERHKSGLKHFHVAVRLSHATRWGPWRKVLQEEHAIYMDFSTCAQGRKQLRFWLQGGYHAVIRYCFLPSKEKTEAELDPEPLLFAADSEGGVHPPLYEAMQKSFSAKAGFMCFEWREQRLQVEKRASGLGRAAPRFQEIDLWPIIVQNSWDPADAAFESRDGYLADFIKRNVLDFDQDHTVVCATNAGGMKFTRRCWAG
eukprot:s2539_g4.t1